MKQPVFITMNFSSFSFLSYIIGCVVLVFTFISLSGCAFLQYGSGDVTPFEISPPMGLEGLTKSQLIARFGSPKGKITDEKGFEHWVYPHESYYYILLYGQGQRMNLTVKFSGDKVIASRLIETGRTINILTQER